MNEQELFDWLKTNHYEDLVHSLNIFDGFDCSTQNHNMFIELKSRTTHYEELLIEKKKYDFLISTAIEKGLVPYYINHTPEGVWSFRLDELPEIEWKDKWLPVTTEFNNKNKMMKPVGFIDVKYASKLL